MFSLKDTLANRKLPAGYHSSMGVAVLCGRRPASITRLRDLPCPESAIVHFKSLVPITNVIDEFITTQFIAMQRLFAEGNVAMLRGTTEDLSGNTALQGLQSLDVGGCWLGQPTQEQRDLFANRNNVGSDDLVIYIVTSLVDAAGGSTNFVGCATHLAGQPGAAVVQSTADWLVAHELGHVLGLRHICEFASASNPTPSVACTTGSGQSDSLMYPNVGWTAPPPNLSDAEYVTLRNSALTKPC